MGKRWSNAMAKATIGRRNLLIWWPCMLVVAESRMDGEIMIFQILLLHSIMPYVF